MCFLMTLFNTTKLNSCQVCITLFCIFLHFGCGDHEGWYDFFLEGALEDFQMALRRGSHVSLTAPGCILCFLLQTLGAGHKSQQKVQTKSQLYSYARQNPAVLDIRNSFAHARVTTGQVVQLRNYHCCNCIRYAVHCPRL